MSQACPKCGAEVAYLQRLISGAAVACEPRTVRESDVVYVRSLHRLHECSEQQPAPVDQSRQRNLFPGEE